jgi:chitinase
MKTGRQAAKAQATQPAGKYIVGYYAAWASNTGFTPTMIDAARLTHVNYAFANIGSDLKITLGFPDIDPHNFSLLNSLKQTNPNLKTLISVGGWTWSGLFSDAALTDSSRKTFADSCVVFMKLYGFDGVDIDWEYPVSGGLPTNMRRPEDKHNFTLLLRTLREALDAQGTADGRHYMLTIAGGAGNYYPVFTELSLIHPYLDYACIMTYDIHGTWDIYTDFNAPLYINNDISPHFKWSVDSGIREWQKAGFPLNKLMMGIPFYGYLYASVNDYNDGLYQPYYGANSIPYSVISSYYLTYPGFTRFFHPESKAPWLFNGSIFISYDDPESIRYKSDYIKANSMGGAMVWELSEDSDRVLLSSLFESLK